MDVSDIKLLQAIYYIPVHHLLFVFICLRSFLIAELQKLKIQIDLIDEERLLFAADNKVILFLPEVREDKLQIKVILSEILIP